MDDVFTGDTEGHVDMLTLTHHERTPLQSKHYHWSTHDMGGESLSQVSLCYSDEAVSSFLRIAESLRLEHLRVLSSVPETFLSSFNAHIKILLD